MDNINDLYALLTDKELKVCEEWPGNTIDNVINTILEHHVKALSFSEFAKLEEISQRKKIIDMLEEISNKMDLL